MRHGANHPGGPPPATARRAASIAWRFAAILSPLSGTLARADYSYSPSDFATSVISYTPGTGIGSDFISGQSFSDPTAALGRPTTDTTGDPFSMGSINPVPVVPAYPAFRATELVSIGGGGSLTLAFDHPVIHDPANPYAEDFILFGNMFQQADTPWTNGDPNAVTVTANTNPKPAVVSVSPDNIHWYTFTNGPYADTFAPTLGHIYDPANANPALFAGNAWWAGVTNPTLPLNPAINAASLNGQTVAQVAQTYGQSAGGTGFNIAALGLSSIQYVRITNAAGTGFTPSIDAASIVGANTWTGPAAGGTFSPAGNWSTGITPSAAFSGAAFRNAATATTITLDTPATLPGLSFDSAQPFTLAGSSATLTLQGSPAALVVASGNHTLAVPVHFASAVSASINAGASLAFAGPLSVDPGVTLTKTGGGTLTLSAAGHLAAVDVASGTLAFTGGTTRIDSLTLSAGATLTLDSARLILTSGNSDDLTSLLAASAAAGWQTTGITSSAAAADPQHRAVGMLSGQTYLALHGPGALFGDQTVSDSDILLMSTYAGDADLSGTITADDYSAIDAGYTLHLSGYANGDFNYDGSVNAADYQLIDTAYAAEDSPQAAGMVAAHTAEFGPAYAGAIPEPCTLALLLSALPVILRRRSRTGNRPSRTGGPR